MKASGIFLCLYLFRLLELFKSQPEVKKRRLPARMEARTLNWLHSLHLRIDIEFSFYLILKC
jgi:hypothetical protein